MAGLVLHLNTLPPPLTSPHVLSYWYHAFPKHQQHVAEEIKQKEKLWTVPILVACAGEWGEDCVCCEEHLRPLSHCTRDRESHS